MKISIIWPNKSKTIKNGVDLSNRFQNSKLKIWNLKLISSITFIYFILILRGIFKEHVLTLNSKMARQNIVFHPCVNVRLTGELIAGSAQDKNSRQEISSHIMLKLFLACAVKRINCDYFHEECQTFIPFFFNCYSLLFLKCFFQLKIIT